MIVFVDIDGVLANCDHRLHYLKEKDYDSFYSDEEMIKDSPIEAGLNLLETLLLDPMCKVVLLTGRPYRTENITRKWLKEYIYSSYSDIENLDIIMRKNHDFRPSEVVKVEALKKFGVDKLSVASLFIDDDPKNVKAVEEGCGKVQGLLFGTSRL